MGQPARAVAIGPSGLVWPWAGQLELHPEVPRWFMDVICYSMYDAGLNGVAVGLHDHVQIAHYVRYMCPFVSPCC